jgi:hypothetical protein
VVSSTTSRPLSSSAGLLVAVALDVAEEVGGALRVRRVGGVVPGLDERLGRHRRAVVEGPAVLERDGPDLVVLGLDRLRDRVVGDLGGLQVVADERREQRLEDLVALALRGVAGDERVLGVVDLHREAAAGLLVLACRRLAVVAAAARGGAEGEGEQDGGQPHTCGWGLHL